MKSLVQNKPVETVLDQQPFSASFVDSSYVLTFFLWEHSDVQRNNWDILVIILTPFSLLDAIFYLCNH